MHFILYIRKNEYIYCLCSHHSIYEKNERRTLYMKTAAIIAEFNPFHNGHAYLIKEAKKKTGADRVVIIMSGNFVQRGEPAFMDKFTRAEMALKNGADLVVELPIVYATGSAAYFALGAVKMVKKLRTVDYLCFGSETANIELLKTIASIIQNEDDIYTSTLQSYLKHGFSFARSRENAILKSIAMSGMNISAETVQSVLNSPNSILAIEYLIALKKSNCYAEPVAIKRTDAGYKNMGLTSSHVSAMAIRSLYQKPSVLTFNNIRETLSSLVPSTEHELLEKYYKKTYPIYQHDFDNIVGYSLIKDRFEDLKIENLFDSTQELANRIRKFATSYTSIEAFTNDCNAPTITTSRINRILLYMLFGYTKGDFEEYKKDDYIYYFRVLGFNKEHSDLLSQISKNTPFPIITQPVRANEVLSKNGMKMFLTNMYADELYRMVAMNKYGYSIPTEEEHELAIL